MTPIQSNMLSAIGYDPTTKTLRVQYARGGEYEHANVPPEVHEKLMAAESKGKFFSANVRNQYPGTKYVRPEKVAV